MGITTRSAVVGSCGQPPRDGTLTTVSVVGVSGLRVNRLRVKLGGKQIDNEQVEHYGDTKERKGSPEQRPRVENHSKYGFGELRVKPVTPDESNVKKRRSRSTDKRTMSGKDSTVSRSVRLTKVDHIVNN